MNAGVLGMPSQRIRHFEGDERSLDTSLGTIVWEHHLGRIPSSHRVVLVNKTAENGYVPGDEIPAEYFWVGNGTDGNVPPAFAVRVSAQRISVKIHETAGQVRSVTAAVPSAPDPNSSVTPTFANWRLKAYWTEIQPVG